MKLSRTIRASVALPKAERDKRDVEQQKRWRREQRAAERAEKSKPKQSREEITAEIMAELKAMRAEIKGERLKEKRPIHSDRA